MSTQTVSPRTLAEMAEEQRRANDNQARFEKAYTLARGKQDERQSIIAQGVLDNGGAIREIRTALSAVSCKVDATAQTLSSLDRWLRSRFATEDEEKGKIIAEFARLDSADAASEKRDERVGEEITAMHRRQESERAAHAAALAAQQQKHEEAVSRAEQDRARGTIKAGIAAALPAAVFSYLKEHPGAFEAAWKTIAAAIGAGH